MNLGHLLVQPKKFNQTVFHHKRVGSGNETISMSGPKPHILTNGNALTHLTQRV